MDANLLGLLARDKCLYPDCPSRCAGFFVADSAGLVFHIPPDPTTLCSGCGHPWFSHWGRALPENDPRQHFRRGVCSSTKCGSFFSRDLPWHSQRLCVCTAPWGMHALIGAEIETQPTRPSSTVSIAGSSAAPISIFSGAPAPALNSAMARLSHSLSSMPTHRSSGQAPAFGTPTHQDVDVLILPYVRDRKGSNYVHNTHPSPDMCFRLEDWQKVTNQFKAHNLTFACSLPRDGPIWSELDQAFGKHCETAHFTIRTAQDVDANTDNLDDLKCLNWELRSPGKGRRPSESIFFKFSDWVNAQTLDLKNIKVHSKNVVNHLNKQRLLLVISPLYSNICGPISALLSTSIPRLPTDSQPHQCFAWYVCWGQMESPMNHGEPMCLSGEDGCPGYNIKDTSTGLYPSVPGPRTTQPALSLVESTVAVAAASSTSSSRQRSHSMDTNAEQERNPRRARLEIQSTPEAIPAPSLGPEMQPSGPPPPEITSLQPSGPPPPEITSLQASGPPPPEMTSLSSVPQDIQTTSAGTPPSLTTIDHTLVAPQTNTTPSHQREIQTTTPIQYIDWKILVRAIAGPGYWGVAGESSDRFYVHGTSVKAVGDTIMHYIESLHAHEIANHDDGVVSSGHSNFQFGITSLEIKSFNAGNGGWLALFRGDADVRVNDSVGVGLKRSVMRYVMSEAAPADKQHWKGNERLYIQPVITPWQNLPARNARSRMWGTCAALHIVYLHLAPIPISPFLLYRLVRPALDCPLDLIRFVDPKAAEVLEPWYDLDHTDPLPTSPTSPILQIFIEATGLTAAHMSSQRTPSTHQGHPDLDGVHDFKEFKIGFDVKLTDGRSLLEAFPNDPKELTTLLKALYNRDVLNMEHIIGALRFMTTDYSDNVKSNTLSRLFQLRVIRYLLGHGHPNHPTIRGTFVTDQVFVATQNNPSIRAKMFIIAMTGSDLIPNEVSWKLKIRLHHKAIWLPGWAKSWYRDSRRANSVINDPPIFFHTCDSACDIIVHDSIEAMLSEPLGDPGTATAFDAWFHGSMMTGLGFSGE
ncbi:uncharacterized protein STEHIDRAFT_159515 [Stereum hirsutum FP-91666 SS1]|uniref:uncharacterized protein n=1 Tax=Stereum hirsutum (strain FP-91666) TaxID=721885 RepID=UPI0004449565|nr:uncharacterized protein STEHIDRAFT_159515 [Stereum hirsutum FP-91666 SS1]EIM83905.1 hypothetical protein STEHIDRAFT_159515 [Stereum hirsutum FP-91666 SS1]